MSILVVVDEVLVRDWNVVQLSLMGQSVLCASNGMEALSIFKKIPAKIDLIILDMHMPVLGGLETYRCLRQLSKYVPIVVCSSSETPEINFFMETDKFLFIKNKPYKIKDILKFMDNKPLYGNEVKYEL